MAKHSEFNQIVDGVYNAAELAVRRFKDILAERLDSLASSDSPKTLEEMNADAAAALGMFYLVTSELKTPQHAGASLTELKRGVLYDGAKN